MNIAKKEDVRGVLWNCEKSGCSAAELQTPPAEPWQTAVNHGCDGWKWVHFPPICITLQRTKGDMQTVVKAVTWFSHPFTDNFLWIEEKILLFLWSERRRKEIMNRCKVGREHVVTAVTTYLWTANYWYSCSNAEWRQILDLRAVHTCSSHIQNEWEARGVIEEIESILAYTTTHEFFRAAVACLFLFLWQSALLKKY